MLNQSGKKIVTAIVAFAFVGGFGILAASQAYGNENTNIQATNNANEYTTLPFTFSIEDFLQQMETTNNEINNGTISVDNQTVQPGEDASSIIKRVDEAVSQYEKDNPGVTVTEEGREQLALLFRNEQKTPYNAPSSSNNYLKSNNVSTSHGTPNNFNMYSQNALQYVIESNPEAVTTQAPPPVTTTPNVVAQAPADTTVAEPVIQNIEPPPAPENVPPAPEQQQPQPQQIVEQPVVPENTNEVRVEPLISKAIEDNIAAAATVTNTEPVIVEKEPTRGAGLFGEDGILAHIVSNPVLRAGIAAFPILIIILIAGFMISRRNEE